jgi:uncharacterized membrane protein
VTPTDAVLTGVLILATSLWLGGLVAIAVVARVAARTLDPAARIAFFRALGRFYGVVGTAALLVAYATGAALLRDQPWGTASTVTVVVAAALAVTLAGMVQARRMTRLRRRMLEVGGDAVLTTRVRRGALGAHALRGLIGVLSLALLALGVLIAS